VASDTPDEHDDTTDHMTDDMNEDQQEHDTAHADATGDGRRARSARSRSTIARAAHAAFVDHGYVGTTIEAIADLAGVSAQTVYAAFGSKRSLLAAVLDATIVGDHDDVPLIERDWVAALERIDDADEAASHLGSGVTGVLARTAPIFAVLARASADPALTPLLAENRRRRRQDVEGLVTILAANRLMRGDLTVTTGADALFALASEDVYLLLVDECGWSRHQVEAWITDSIRRLILA
jgi:AcrR family transcriptional regulator